MKRAGGGVRRVSKIGERLTVLWLATRLAATAATPLSGGGQSVTLAWNPSPDGNVIGYQLYYGTTSRNYTGRIAAGLNLTATVSGLTQGTPYYFAVTAINSLGMESAYSNEISYTPPAPGSRVEVRSATPQQVVLRITGQLGHVYEIQASRDLRTWSVIGTVTLNLGVSLDFLDVSTAGRPACFYRLREVLN